MTPVSFSGTFQLWSYTVSHGQLLLRSTKSVDRESQIDVLFSDVTSMSLATVLVNLEIVELSDERLEKDVALYSASQAVEDGQKIFQLLGENHRGHVIASSVHWLATDQDYFDQSPLVTK